jgi:hypothetical protein
MNIDILADRVHDQLIAAAALGDERTQHIAAALADSGQAAVRLAILDAVTAACGEVNAALFDAAPGHSSPAVSAQLDSDELRILVTDPPIDDEEPERADDGEATARISLRLSDRLKSQIEDAASRADVSVNTWLVRVASSAVAADSRSGSGPWSGGFGRPGTAGSFQAGPGRGTSRITGWVTG